MNEPERTLETHKQKFLKKEYKFFKWIYDSYDSWLIDNEDDLTTCKTCKCYYWEGLEKMCGCDRK